MHVRSDHSEWWLWSGFYVAEGSIAPIRARLSSMGCARVCTIELKAGAEAW